MSPITKDPGVCPVESLGLVCLPPISDDLHLVWTQAELTNELDDHPQLVHTFSYFPYPSMPEIALLCLRYGLQMEKVKTWFMAKRIRCGISWSSEEIEETRSRLLYNQDQLHFKPLIAIAKKANTLNSQEKLDISTPKYEAKQEVSPQPSCTALHIAAAEAKRSRTDFAESERNSAWAAVDYTTHRLIQSPFHVHHSESNVYTIPQQGLKEASKHPHPGQMFGVAGTEISTANAGLPSEEDLVNRVKAPSWKLDSYSTMQVHRYHVQSGGVFRGEDSYMPVMRRQRKTKEQLTILKSFFLKCQWASRQDYKKLEELSGLPRSDIIQWFGDTRYALKHGQLKWFRDNAQERPSWLDEPQHLVTPNGRHSELGVGGSPCVEKLTTLINMPVNDTRTVVQPLSTSAAPAVLTPAVSSGVHIPVEQATGVCSISTGNTKFRNSETLDTSWATVLISETEGSTALKVQNCSGLNGSFANSSESSGQRVPTGLQAVEVHSPHPPSPIPAATPQLDFSVLERYWCVHRHIKEIDLQSLITESKLDRQQVLDWFCHKSNEPAEVEVCLDDEEENNEEIEEEDYEDDVVIQD